MAVIDISAKYADHLVQNHNRMKKENLNTDPCLEKIAQYMHLKNREGQ